MKHRVFIDANVLVSVLLKEYPTYTWSSRLLSLADSSLVCFVTTPIVIAIAFYFTEKKHGTAEAHRRISMLAERITVCSVSHGHVQAALSHVASSDLEDAIQYYAALDDACTLIVTENKSDFWYSIVPVMNAQEALSYLHADFTTSASK